MNLRSRNIPQINPNRAASQALLNPLILKRIFRYCEKSGSDFANYRLVCRTWRDVSLPDWRSTASLTLLKPKSAENSEETAHLVLLLEDFIQLYSKDQLELRSRPFQKYRLKWWDLDKIEDISGHHKHQFSVDDFGLVVTQLHVDHCSSAGYYAENFFRDIVFRTFPNLEVLRLTHNKFKVAHDNDGPRTLSKNELLRNTLILSNLRTIRLVGQLPFSFWLYRPCFPNLEKLELEGSDCETDFLRWGFLFNQEDYHNHALKTIDIPDCELQQCSFITQTLVWLAGSVYSPPLEYLSMDVSCINFALFYDLLEAFSDTLKVLKLWRKPIFTISEFSSLSFMQDMTPLVELYLYGTAIENFRFYLFMPNLEKLYISTSGYEMWDKLKRDEEHCNFSQLILFTDNVVDPESLEIVDGVVMEFLRDLYVDVKFAPETLARLKKWAPNLSTLHTIADNHNLETICEMWPKLEELDLLHGSSVDDEGIQVLGSLPGLRRFTLETYCNEGKLTDLSVHKVFLLMQSLNCLRICVSPQMTEAAESFLRSSILNVTLLRNYGEGPHGECCRRRIFNEFIQTNVDSQM